MSKELFLLTGWCLFALSWVFMAIAYRGIRHINGLRHRRTHGAFVVGDIVAYHDKMWHQKNVIMHIHDVIEGGAECMYAGHLYHVHNDGTVISSLGLAENIGESRLQRLPIIQLIPTSCS